MKIEDKINYIHITSDKDVFIDFFNAFSKSYPKLAYKHIILEIFDNINITEKDILLFLTYVEKHQNNKLSFIIVRKKLDVDNVSDAITVVPTLTEAEDVLEMENIERDLGF